MRRKSISTWTKQILAIIKCRAEHPTQHIALISFKLATVVVAAQITSIALNKVFPYTYFQPAHLFIAKLTHLTNILSMVKTAILFLSYSIVWLSWIVFIIYVFRVLVKSSFKPKPCSQKLIEDEKQAELAFTSFKDKCENRKALMIVGKWGCGKTSFYKKSLKPKLEDLKRTIVEISCFGVSSVHDLIIQILNNVIQIESFAIITNLVKKLLSTSNDFKKLLVPKKITIVIDDFERYAGNYAELLGFLDFLIQQKSCHLLILCNEENISNITKYKEFSEKIIAKHHFLLPVELIEKILKSETFNFNGQHYTFSKPIVKHFVQITNKLENIRAANDAHIDLITIGKKLITQMKFVALPEVKKEEYLKDFFETSCSHVIKAVFIKNTHTERDYFEYLGERKEASKNKKEEPQIKHHVLKILDNIKLEPTAVYQQIKDLINYPSIKAYLEGNIDAFDNPFYDEIIEQYLLNNINQEIKKHIDDHNNKEPTKEAFFAYFKFIQERNLVHRDNAYPHPLVTFLLFQLWLTKFNISIKEDEQDLVDALETELGDKIPNSISNILEKRMFPNDVLGKTDPDFSLLEKLEQHYLKRSEF